jgi:hypothetical protein
MKEKKDAMHVPKPPQKKKNDMEMRPNFSPKGL